MSEPLKRYWADECCKPGWEDARFYLCSDVDRLLARRAPQPNSAAQMREAFERGALSEVPPLISMQKMAEIEAEALRRYPDVESKEAEFSGS